MKTSVIFCLSVLFLLSSCSGSRNNAEREVILLNENYLESVPVEEVFSVVKDAVKLQDDTSFVLNSIKKIVGIEDGIYLTDGTVICHYAQDGCLASYISRRGGRGPGEYVGIMDFDIDGDIVYVLDKNKKFLKCDSAGNLIQEKMLGFYPASFMVYGDLIILTSAYQEPGNKFIVFDKRTLDEKNSYYPIEKNEVTWRHFMEQSNFFRYEDTILFHEPMNCDIYAICKDTVTVKYSFDFWGHNAHETFWKQKYRNVFAINQDATSNNYCFGTPCYAESDKSIIMTYRDGAFYEI